MRAAVVLEILLVRVIAEMLRISLRHLRGLPVPPSAETGAVATRLVPAPLVPERP